jgi:hypothetical protein
MTLEQVQKLSPSEKNRCCAHVIEPKPPRNQYHTKRFSDAGYWRFDFAAREWLAGVDFLSDPAANAMLEDRLRKRFFHRFTLTSEEYSWTVIGREDAGSTPPLHHVVWPRSTSRFEVVVDAFLIAFVKENAVNDAPAQP